MKKRHYAVDGLKGLAIIAVIFTHIPLRVWYGSVPGYLHSLLDIILGSGGIGVTIFFILTGFLMGRLYELPSSSLSFWRRRYARLFPPFLVMVASFTIFHLIPGLAPIFQVFIFLVCAFGMWAVWKVFFKIASKKQWGKMGYNDSVIHTDIVSTENRTVTAFLPNGKSLVIYKNGKFTI